MKQVKFRIGAISLASALAAATVVSAFALQSDRGPSTDDRRASITTTIEDEPIRYAGGYGLYPTIK